MFHRRFLGRLSHASSALIGPLFARQSVQFYLLAPTWIMLFRIVLQGSDRTFSAIATNPNMPPLPHWVLLLLSGWFAVCQLYR